MRLRSTGSEKARVRQSCPLNGESPRQLGVAIFTPRGLGGSGGIDCLMTEVHDELKAGRYFGVKPYFITTRGSDSLSLSPFFLLRALLRLGVLWLFDHVDVAHINLTKSGSTYRKLLVARACRLLRIPYVLHLHSGIYDKFWDSCTGLLKTEIDKMFSKSQRTIVMGNYWKEVVVERSPASNAKTVIIPNAARAVTEEVPKGGEQVNILFLGFLGPGKGVPELISALSRLPPNIPWVATLAGNGAIEETRAAVCRAGLIDRVNIPGWVQRQQRDRLLRAATIFVLPSFSENFPLSVVEAFANGVAVICTSVGAVPEIVEHERTGLLVKPGDVQGLADALLRLARDKEMRERLGRNARAEQMKRFEMTGYIRRLIAVWSEAATQCHRSVTARHPKRIIERSRHYLLKQRSSKQTIS